MMFNQVATNIHAVPSSVKLSEIINDIPVVQLSGPWDVEIAGITTDSRQVRAGWMFVAIEGEHVDGHDYVQSAMEQGASCVVVQLTQYETHLQQLLTPAYSQHSGTTVVIVQDSRATVAQLADRFHGSPARALTTIGITGTNGKTTIAFLISSVLEAAGIRSGMIGTVAYRIGDDMRRAPYTTPPAEYLHGLLAEIRDAGCSAVVMEVSSHALALDRIGGVEFDLSIFTNLTQDHLDFHGDMQSYRDAKALLFTRHTRGVALINTDDAAGGEMGRELGRSRHAYGTKGSVRYRISDVTANTRGTWLTVTCDGEEHRIASKLIGGFNAWNLAAAFAAGIELGIEAPVVLRGLRMMERVPGRFERIISADGVTAIVDYSHTPDSLEKALTAARNIAHGKRVITVFGCGGDRDREKRPLMGAVASELGDMTIVTSDNPRSEDPEAIIADILTGVKNPERVKTRTGRRGAIRQALKLAAPGDIVLVAGKGHETYQIIGSTRRHFDDREIVRAYFEEQRGGVRP
ncbi:MAG: UDP-N-acetylmuramoyl-L-alanyl-D-glutamate--2,6-diaminopimelate ligase [Bacteroidota bacterium]|nr:UDP-N-acetylmuramoyl-L-alanyl-D-glutamate--2,6-diaminopimelate ligase [Bacteroidota bacterium]